MSADPKQSQGPGTVHSIQLSPLPFGCGWIRTKPIYEPPTCPEPIAYTLTSPLWLNKPGYACIEHTALMRELHPEWVASVALHAPAASDGPERDR